ncbi:TetR/AcrR family transcriptional regulator [Puniceibacterium sediminis]|uniref:Transcriptional regulator, TetR family n=1 Tax=Puniceibacterium sediminis TaxID=1608407 RepID=A0A238ZHQ6_9RHOB|nr:TetR/AcrR family transcriptional regulator [Puniceibacterium sediminis]SNR82223.1 transcriptional regulator, TetR family [Puniceibacterium sediminis]
MAPTLRQRRQEKTSRDIRLAALELCTTKGLDSVTAEAISARAGISLRTFFNYYPNKETAIVARPPGFPEKAIAAFNTGHGSLAEDLTDLLRAHLALLDEDRDIMLLLHELLRDNKVLRAAHEASLKLLHSDLADILAHRMTGQSRAMVDLFAGTVLIATGQLVQSMQDETPLADRAPEAWTKLRDLADLIR